MRTKLRHNEEIYLITHHHWLVMLRPIFFVLLTGGFTYLMYSFAEELNTKFYMWLSFGLFFLATVYAFFRWYERSVNIWAVTNYRVIEEEGVFSILAKESPLDKINNISYQQTFWGRILGYGDVEIQTAAGEGMTIHRFISNPKRLKDNINEAKDRYLMDRNPHNRSSHNNQAVEQAQQHLRQDVDDEAGLEEVVVNLYQQTDMEIAQIAAMVNRDKHFVLEVLMNRRLLEEKP